MSHWHHTIKAQHFRKCPSFYQNHQFFTHLPKIAVYRQPWTNICADSAGETPGLLGSMPHLPGGGAAKDRFASAQVIHSASSFGMAMHQAQLSSPLPAGQLNRGWTWVFRMFSLFQSLCASEKKGCTVCSYTTEISENFSSHQKRFHQELQSTTRHQSMGKWLLFMLLIT